MGTLQEQISDATKAAMKAREKDRVAVLRLINAEIKRFEVDERAEATDEVVLDILNRMQKQRNDSIKAFEDAGRTELVAQETMELEIIREFLPAQLDEAEITAVVTKAIADIGAESMKDMGKVMGAINGPLKGKADMGQSQRHRKRVAGLAYAALLG